MTNKLEDYLNKIRKALHGWESADINDAVAYYEEFIEDALEGGLSENQILDKLGKPEQIVKTIKTEKNIQNAESNPGPLKLLKSIIGVPFLKVSIVMGGIIPIITAYLLYILAVISYIAVAGGILFSVYAIRQIDPQYVWSVIGMIGLAFISAALFVLFGFTIWKIANLITMHTMKLLRRFLNREKQLSPRKYAEGKRHRTKSVLIILLITFTVGVIMLLPSGLPERYFSIWNSRMPDNYKNREMQFLPEKGKSISIETLNSKVIIRNSDSGRITVLYQQPDWMKGNIKSEESVLSISEEPNGRLPCMHFVSRHEGMTSVTVGLPEESLTESIKVHTNGGTVEVAAPVSKQYGITGETEKGTIIVNNKIIKGRIFKQNIKGKGVINIKNKFGNIIIK